MKCRKFNMKIEENSCNLTDCEHRKTCIGEKNSTKTINPKTEPIKPNEVVSEHKNIANMPEIVSDVVETLVSERNNSSNSDENKELEITKEQTDIIESKQIQVRRFNAKVSPDGINLSLNGDINLIMTKKVAIALSNILQKIIMDEKNMTNLGDYLGEEKVDELIPSEALNKTKKLYRFNVSSASNEDEFLSVKLKLSDKSQVEFSISKGIAMALGATLLNKSKLSEGE